MTRINKLDNINCAKFIFEQIYNQQACKKKINIALSGGKTPLPILKLWSNYDLDWNNIKFFQLMKEIIILKMIAIILI